MSEHAGTEHKDPDLTGAEGCPFCERIRGGAVSWSEGTAVAFPDGFPLTEGHTLVVPRRHEADLLALSGEEAADLWTLARRVCQKWPGGFGQPDR